MLGAELGRAVGLGGRARRAGGAAERARSAVQRRIKNAIDRIGEHAPALAALLSKDRKNRKLLRLSPGRHVRSPLPRGRGDRPRTFTFRKSRLLVRGDGRC